MSHEMMDLRQAARHLHIDENELRKAEWVKKEDIIGQPNPGSLTHEMMIVFKEGRL